MMPRFVILEHDHPYKHWDLMLQAGNVLRTWRLAEPLSARTAAAAEAIVEHRLKYLDYEGPVGGGRGRVVRWDHGEVTWILDRDDEVVVRLDGERCTGELRLVRLAAERWQATFTEP
jgi:hypothetical protein